MKKREKSKPYLAHAVEPFTPMMHKQVKSAETPYQPLKLNDLATPKLNKSHSSTDQIDKSMESDDLPSDEVAHQIENGEIAEVKQALMVVLNFLDKLSKNQPKPKQMKSVSVQTSSSSGQLFQRKTKTTASMKRKSPEKTEISFSDPDSSDSLPISIRKPEVEKKKYQYPDTPSSPSKRSAFKTTASSSSGAQSGSEGDIQQRMRDMSLLLRKLEDQLDGINDK